MFFKTLTLAVALLASGASVAAPGARSLERAMETTTNVLTLPAQVPASFTARGCFQCQALQLQIPADAHFFVGRDEVSFSQLRDFAQGKTLNMTIFYKLDAPVVRRIIVAGELPSTARTQRKKR